MLSQVRNSPLLRSLTAGQIDQVLSCSELKRLKKGEVLFRQDEPVESIFLVASGQVKLQQVIADGAQSLIRFVGPGEICAIVSALDVQTYPLTAIAERDASVIYWDGRTFNRLLLGVPELTKNALSILSTRVREMQQRFGELAAERTERRLARALLRLVSQLGKKTSEGTILDLSLSRRDLAEMIGTTLYSVSRILSDWQKRHWVKIGRQKVAISDVNALVRFSEEEDA